MPSLLRHCGLGDRKGSWPMKTECWYVGSADLSGACPTVLAVTTATFIISCCSKIQDALAFWFRLSQVVMEQWQLKRVYDSHKVAQQ